jgi:DNA processing protein
MDLQMATAAAVLAGTIRSDRQLKSGLEACDGLADWLVGRAPPLPLRSYPRSVRATGWGEHDYPRSLRPLSRPPPALFVRGCADPLPPSEGCVAMIGARRCTEVGLWAARDLAAGLARAGIVVVSGLALGIDAAAHEGALDGGGRTLAVLASPVDRPGPARNLPLAREIVRDRGWLVSERPPGARVLPADFPHRNRLVAALASVVIVVEAGLPSGTLSTVQRALALGRAVGAVPGPISSPASAGANALLVAGAVPITCVEDVLALLGRGRASREAGHEGSADERRLLRGLPGAGGSVDAWIQASGLPDARGRRALAQLLARGALRHLPGGRVGRIL